ncbi:MAG: BspA family leucine-rich repeat surface protein, partial [Bacteroidota bacterium]
MLKSIFNKTIFLVVLIVAQNANAAPSDDFIITVKTDNPGLTGPSQFRIRTSGGGYNYNVDCNDDGIDDVIAQTTSYICDYGMGNEGIYTIRIKDRSGVGTGFPRIRYNNSGDKLKILSIEQWGTGIWTSMQAAFYGASVLIIPATDSPNFSIVTDMESMFRGATSANPDTSNWVTSSVTNMSSMFAGAAAANPDTSNWMTSSVTNMSSMFAGAAAANPDTSNWDTSLVTSMFSMFNGAAAANPDTSNWNTSSVTSMFSMFSGALLANPDVTGWDVTNVATMANMFLNVTLPIDDYDALLNSWNGQMLQAGVPFHAGNSRYCATVAHLNMTKSFGLGGHGWNITDAGVDVACPDPLDDFVIVVKTDNPGLSTSTKFLIPTVGGGYDYNVDCNDDGIDEASAQSGDYVCNYGAGNQGTYTIRIKDNSGAATGFPRIHFNNGGDKDKILSIQQWGRGIWTSMAAAFYGASNLDIAATDIPDLSSVTNMSQMFQNAVQANPDTSGWNTSTVTTMQVMFQNAIAANPDTSNWDTSAVTNMGFMFAGATLANPDVTGWDVTNVTSMAGMFLNVTLPIDDYDAMLNNWNGQMLQAGVIFHAGNSTYCATAAHDNLTNSAIHNWSITDAGVDVDCPGPPSDDFVISVKTDNPGQSTSTRFFIPATGVGRNYNVDCNDDGIDEASAQTSGYTCDFGQGNEGTYTIRIKDNSGAATGFPGIRFNNSVDQEKILSIEQWGTGIWTSMDSAFYGAVNLTIPATDNPNFSSVVSMNSMFNDAISANPDTSNWDTSSVTSMGRMFADAISANPNTSGWNTSSVTDMRGMFNGATSANPNTSGWNTSSVTNMNFMFFGATSANPDTSTWDITSVTNMSLMFLGVTLPSASYDAMLIGFNSQNVQNGVSFHGGFSKVCSLAAIAARGNLINSDNWIINDGGECIASDDFIITVKTDNPGISTSTQFIISMAGTGLN